MRNLYLAIIAILLLAEVITMINWHQDVKELHDEIKYVYTELQELRYEVKQSETEQIIELTESENNLKIF
jgi:uncharacterized protein YoxC